MTTLYATLGVQADATLDEIKLAYRRAAMKWHPDRNPGREAESHAAFQQIRDAYAILSDAEQRQVYDDVFEREMRRWEAEHAAQEAEERQAQEEARRVAQEHYEQMVAIAMRFADAGHSRDVLFGILLGKDCETDLAAQIADSVHALQASRQACAGQACDEAVAPADAGNARTEIPVSAFEAFWQGLFRFR
ncbi:J domain-containing protein [Cupriavidus taiwanensis]|uniref:Putative heat shock protein, dnaJ domain n=1 Tax=Cupriavidus taiwanensis TaxID=164546 RepID=A0A7Z7NNN7_9BURK|nr:J domain-containing protein [Cupriavidus taiwanensis]SOZ09806.1 putative heat shock protein, dnaJ domain [Cupriavidus taiwanensis]SOZ11924.1 putative heat shock protein, dnaJ domain [Cupriavidus taiwanensis]SOZ43279.1 putative heat shock protein, dnaJ domain [Cupriavidus taiwanensis]SPC22525.1 putative heat shock protein, dnaJ domain [Cupriavidus taiwanensis]SPD54035.1 putative heat shock protein, dnaJ domain [Cupriavidus taiwanensis]